MKKPVVHAPCPIPDWDVADVGAIQALARGTADPHQQVRALKWIVEKACARYEIPFDPVNHSVTDFMCGRLFAGEQIVKLTKIPISKLKGKVTENG